MEGLKEIFEENDIQVVMSGFQAMFSFTLGVDSVTSLRSWAKSDQRLALRIVEAGIQRGVMPDLDVREPWFLCFQHSDVDIDETLEIYAGIVKAAKN
jgi:glutamate-1-semialdehyde aminotransferase